MSNYKNAILIIISIILFIYAGFISIFPSFYTKHFNINDFTQKMLPAAGLNVTFDDIDVKIRPNFKTIIKLKELQIFYPDNQPLFRARTAELITTPSSIISKKFIIKKLTLHNVKYEDQILPSGENKLAFLPSTFNPSVFKTKKITVIPQGNVYVKGLNIGYTVAEPYSYKKEDLREAEYSADQVKTFLKSLNFNNVVIK